MQKPQIPGSKGDYVHSLQMALNASVGTGLNGSGAYGPKTTEAVKAWQGKVGLPANGVFQFPASGGMQGSATPVSRGSKPGGAPLWFDVALAEIGVEEVSGTGNNTRVLGYLRSLSGHFKKHKWTEGMEADATAWCACFVNWCLTQAGQRAGHSAFAKDWQSYGAALAAPRVGAVTVVQFASKDPGVTSTGYHVGFFAGWTAKGTMMLLGGNQTARNVKGQKVGTEGVTVTFLGIPSTCRVVAYRWPR